MPNVFRSITALVLSLGLLNASVALAAILPSKQLLRIPTHPYSAESVAIVSPAGNITLRGSLLLPAGDSFCSAVILLPDMGAEFPTYDDMLLSSLADSLARQGVIVLRLDERGTGNSGGKPGQTLISDRLSDVAAALKMLRTRPRVNIKRIGVIGYGLGGNVALLAAAQPLPPTFIVAIAASGISGQKLLAAQIPMYGKVFTINYDKLEQQHHQALGQLQRRQVIFQMQSHGSNAAQVQIYADQQASKLQEDDQKWVAAMQKYQWSMLDIIVYTPDNEQAKTVLSNMLRQRYPTISPEELANTTQLMTSNAYRNYLTLNPIAALANIKCPVLLVQGTADTQVDPDNNLDALSTGLSSNGQVLERRFKDLDHHLRPVANAVDITHAAAPVVYREISHWVQQLH